MPWKHCDRTDISDDVACPACGLSKQEWTLFVDRTRVFRLAPKSQKALKIRLWDEEREDIVPEEPFEVLSIDGGEVLADGALDEEGFTTVKGNLGSMCLVAFPTRGAGSIIPLPSYRPRELGSGRFAVDSDKLIEFQVVVHWIEIQLEDDDGAPVAGERYCVRTSVGELREGTLDEAGYAREEELDPGTCTVWFPDIDKGDSWRAAPRSTVPAWLGVALTEEDGTPIPGAQYVVSQGGGVVAEGTLDDNGQARIEDLKPGSAWVHFPEYAAEAIALPGKSGLTAPSRYVPPTRYASTGTPAPTSRSTAGDPSPEEEQEAPPERGFVEFELLDEAGDPVADEAYELTAPDGETRSGTLDASGQGREDDVVLGTCTLRFPGIDAGSEASARPEPKPDEPPRMGWLEIELEDEDGNPVAAQAVRLLGPDGETREANVNADGVLRLDEVPEGRWKVWLLELDAGELVTR